MKQLFTRILAIIFCLIGGSLYAQDAGVSTITSLDLTNCDVFSQGVTLTVRYTNFGTTNIASVPVGYSINGGTAVNEINAVALPGGANDTYTFTALLTLPTPNSLYTLKIWTAVPGDVNVANDTFQTPIISPGLNALPFSETFENFTAQINPSNAGVLNNGWRRTTTGVFGWHVASNTTPAFFSGPDANHTPLGSNFMFSEASSGILGDVHQLFSPCIDLAGTTAPRLSFWYHMYGANIGTLEAFAIANNDTTQIWIQTGQQQTASSDPWLEAIVDLSLYAGQVISLEFRATRGNGTNGDISLDDIFLFDPAPVDPGVTSVISPSTPTCYGPNETITVELANLGSQPLDLAINPVTLGAQVTGPLSNTYTTTINSGTIPVFGSLQVDITTNADLSAAGTYGIKTYASTPADPNAFNDTTSASVTNLPVSVGALQEDFESFSIGTPGLLANNWTRTNTTNQKGWHVDAGNTPNFGTGPNGNHTPSGFKFLFVEASNNVPGGEVFELASPCIDVSANLAPKMSFWYHMFGPDIGTLEVLIRNGGTNTSVLTLSGEQQTSSNAAYDSALVDLLPFKNDVFQIVFRVTTTGGVQGDIAIDDINIFEPPAFDAQLTRIISPESSCGLSATEPVIIEVVNGGTDTLNSVGVSFNPDNTGFVPNEIIPGILVPGDTIIYTFNATANFGAAGIHTLRAEIMQTTPADQNGTNNSLEITVRNLGSTVTSLPYFEDFENGQGGWSVGGTSPSWAFGTPAKTTIQGAASGVNAWVTGGLGTLPYNNNEASFVIGPCFDFSNVSVPIFEMDIWWSSEWSWDGAVLESSIDGGLSWQRVGRVNDPVNWYTDSTINGLDDFGYLFPDQHGWTGRGTLPTTAGSGTWVHAGHELTGLGGQGAVLLRVIFGSDGVINDDGFAFDNVLIYEKPDFNATAGQLLSPAGGCGFDSATAVTISYINNGTQPFDTLDVFYNINGGPFVVEQATGIVQPGDTGYHTFSTPGNFGNLSITYDVAYGTALGTDSLIVDDTARVNLTPVSIPTVDIFPYVENFDSGPAGWASEAGQGGLNSWALGYPQKSTIQGAASDSNCWVTGGLLTGQYFPNEDSWVIGPCMNMSNLANPQISMSIWYNSEWSWDGAVLQGSVDGGDTWFRIGNVGDPVNWYNDNTINGQPGGQQQGWTGRGAGGGTTSGSGGWINARHALNGLAGQASVRLRVAFGSDGSVQDDGFAFDDVFIWDRASDDIAGISFQNLPRTFCNNDSARIQFEFRNDGTNSQFNFPVQAVITGPNGISDTLNGNYTNPLAPNGSGTIDFGFYGSTFGGTYSVKAYALIPNDTTVFNDTTYRTFTINEITSAPTAVSDSICSANGTDFTLIAQSPSQNVRLQWFDAPTGGNVVAEGDTFVTPILTSSQNFYVEASNSQDFSVGPLGFTAVSNFGAYVTTFNEGLHFNVEEELVLESVKVYPEPNSSGTIWVTVTKTTPPIYNQVRQFNFGGTTSDTTLSVNFTLPVGDGYIIRASGTNLGPGNGLFRNSSGANYPYTLPGLISITRSTLSATSTSYNFFYDWKIRTLGCPSPRALVSAIVQAPPVVNLGLDGAHCGAYSLDVTDPDVVSYQWFQDGNPFATGPTQTIDTTGLYSVLVTNGAGCTGTDSVVLTINQAPVAEAGSDSASCDPILLASDTSINANYFWFSTYPDNQDSSLYSYMANGTGTYILTVNALGCTAKDTVNVTIFPPPNVDLGMDRATCSDITLDAGMGASYLWNTGDTTQTLDLTAPFTVADTISVQVRSAQGCIGIDTVVISEGTPPEVVLPDSIAECDEVTLDAGNPGLSYSWNTGENTRTITVNNSGTYQVTVTNADSCETIAQTNVEILDTPSAAATYAVQPNGFTVAFTNQSTPIDSNTTFLWTFVDGTGSTSTEKDPVYTFPFPGTYQVILEVSNRCGTSTVEILVLNVAVDAYPLDEIISIYPNPTAGEFFLRGDDLRLAELQVEVSDLRGKQIYTYQTEKLIGQLDHKVDIGEQPKGVYIVKISDGSRSVYHRVVKQ